MSRFAKVGRGTRLAAIAACVLGLLVVAPLAGARVPQGFVGTEADGPIFFPGAGLSGQFDRMVASGVETVRVAFSWADAQPYPNWASVPLDQASAFEHDVVPTRWSSTDRIVALAAQRRLTLLPDVLYSPTWDQGPHPDGTFAPPHLDAPYGNYLSALVRRYGPRGSFWRANPQLPKVPIRMWQIWNEPDLRQYWPIQPFPASYMHLVHVAHDAIKRVDRRARVVLAGMPNYVWQYLDEIYAIPGARNLFDAVAVHPFTKEPSGVIEILQRVRGAMDRHGDRSKPIIASELSWPSSLHRSSQYFGFETTPAGQASNIGAVLPMLAAERRRLGLASFYYYTWVSDEYPGAPTFQFAGLFGFHDGRLSVKPAYSVFRRGALALEHCRVKASVATRCLRPAGR